MTADNVLYTRVSDGATWRRGLDGAPDELLVPRS
jgi:hypothetical protein